MCTPIAAALRSYLPMMELNFQTTSSLKGVHS
jgi:hypothetical protein